MDKFYKIIKWAIGPFLLFVLLSCFIESEPAKEFFREHDSVKEKLKEACDAIRVAAYIGFAAIVVNELVEKTVAELVLPMIGKAIREQGTPYFDGKFLELTTAIKDGLGNKPIVIQRTGDPALEEIMDQRVESKLKIDSRDDEDLRKAKDALASKDFPKAIGILDSLVQKSPKYTGHLITALVMSGTPADRARAEPLLQSHGDSDQYQKLAYLFWKDRDTPKAIRVAEEGLKKAIERKESLSALRNSLAYYYADGMVLDKSKLALEYARHEEQERKKEDPNSILYAAALDTLGFVKIQFGKTEKAVEEGLDACTRAQKIAGMFYPLFFKHVSAAERRLSFFHSAA